MDTNLCISILEFKFFKTTEIACGIKNLCISILEFKSARVSLENAKILDLCISILEFKYHSFIIL